MRDEIGAIVLEKNALAKERDALRAEVERLRRLVLEASPWMETAMSNPVDGGDFEECRDWLTRARAALGEGTDG